MRRWRTDSRPINSCSRSCSGSHRPKNRSRRMFGLPRKPDAGKVPPGGAKNVGAPDAAPSNVVALPARNAEGVLRRLEWTVLRRLDGLLHGDYRTLFRGFGLDLADLREYQYHDDVRHIDWNVTARLQTPYVREYNEDRDVTAWFLLDMSPSVDFGSQRLKKRAVSIEFVTVLARLLTRHGNRVGAMFYGDSVDAVIPPRAGRRHVLHLVDAMMRRP